MRKYWHYLTSPMALGVFVTLIFVFASREYYRSFHIVDVEPATWVKRLRDLNQKTIDWRFLAVGERPAHPRVGVLAIDDRSLEIEGRWPWSRKKIAQLIDRSIQDGAKVLAFDVVFSEKDQSTAIPTLQELKRELKSTNQLNKEIEASIANRVEHEKTDELLAKTIEKYQDNIVLGNFYIGQPNDGRKLLPWQYYCLDAINLGTEEYRIWEKDGRKATVVDTVSASNLVPAELARHYGNVIKDVRTDVIGIFLQDNPLIRQRLEEQFWEIQPQLKEEEYVTLILKWMYSQRGAEQILDHRAPASITSPTPAAISDYINQKFYDTFTSRELSTLKHMLREQELNYCRRAWTDKDEHMNFAALKNMIFESQKQVLKAQGKSDDEITKMLDEAEPEIKKAFDDSSWASAYSLMQGTVEAFKNIPFEEAMNRWTSNRTRHTMVDILDWTMNIYPLASTSLYNGYFNAEQDSDGSIRRSPLLVRYGSKYISSLALKAFMVDKQVGAKGQIVEDKILNIPYRRLRKLEIVDRDDNTLLHIPVNPDGFLQINYAGPQTSFPYVSATDILSDQKTFKIKRQDFISGRWGPVEVEIDRKEFMKDKILVVGATAVGVYDLRVTPFEENYPGVETHANVISNLITEFDRKNGQGEALIRNLASVMPRLPASLMNVPGFLQTHPKEEDFMWLVLAGIGLSLSALLSFTGPVSGLLVTTAYLGGTYAIDRFWLFGTGTLVSILWPIMSISSTFVSLSFFKYFTEERKKREL